MSNLYTKLHELKDILTGIGGVLVAYSGGADSTLLLKVALDVLGEKVLAATARAPIFLSSELAAVEEMAHRLGARHIFVEMGVMDDPRFSSNPPDRCYICKRIIFHRLQELAGDYGFEVTDGSNHDDLGEHRPGLKALRELGVRSPLAEAGFTKSEVRALSREMGLLTWDKPAQTCLATRFPYGEQLTLEKLSRVEKAENLLHSLGLRQLRVRSHNSLARIEVSKEDIAQLLSERAPEIVDKLKGLGYAYVTLDLQGYRTGSMDELLRREG
jgi:uncharacterized protein